MNEPTSTLSPEMLPGFIPAFRDPVSWKRPKRLANWIDWSAFFSQCQSASFRALGDRIQFRRASSPDGDEIFTHIYMMPFTISDAKRLRIQLDAAIIEAENFQNLKPSN